MWRFARGCANGSLQTKKQWRVPRKGGDHQQPKTIEPGDSGIWVTCSKGKEGKCIGEIMDLFTEYAERLYPQAAGEGAAEDDEDEEEDIEKAIKTEVKEIRKPGAARLFTPVKINVQCGACSFSHARHFQIASLTNATVIFIKTIAPVEPVSLVKTICEEAMANRDRKRTRFAQRLSPMTLMGRASTEGLEKVAQEVLAPHFHQEPFQKRTVCLIICCPNDKTSFVFANANTYRAVRYPAHAPQPQYLDPRQFDQAGGVDCRVGPFSRFEKLRATRGGGSLPGKWLA